MAYTNAFQVEMVNPEDDDSTLKNAELLDSAMEDVRNKKKTLVSAMDSVIGLMKEVECEEKSAEQAEEEAEKINPAINTKVDELMQAQQQAEEKIVMHNREICALKSSLAAEMKDLQLFVSSLLDDGDRSIAALDEMHRALEERMTSARKRKDLAHKKKLEKEAFSRVVLAFHELKLDAVVAESERLQQEAAEISKLQHVFYDRHNAAALLLGEMSDKIRDVKLLQDELEQGILQSKLPISTKTTSETPYQQPAEIMGSYKTATERTSNMVKKKEDRVEYSC